MKPELLSPAGSPEALRAAVQSGADAVYLGWGSFNARGRAKGFSDEEFLEALRYCHVRGVRVFLTLNILLTDRELPQALELARRAGQAGVDAVLVQDWGLFAALRQSQPDLPLHASTQMSVFTSGGTNTLFGDGCRRVVLARECSREDVALIRQRTEAEIEVFVHGALCMCCSGQCAMSALVGGRSGNRGLCAQPCRLPYAVDGEKGCPLSLKDNCLAPFIPQLSAMGVDCLKIEGRLKRPEYVAVVTEIYARLLRENRGPDPAESAALQAAFSREGFTDGYWTGLPDKTMFGVRSREDADALFREARERVSREERTVPLRFSCRVRPEEPACLTLTDGEGRSVTVTGDVPQSARNRALSPREVEERLGKTGGTPFRMEAGEAEVAENLFLSAGAVNALRREGLAAMERAREKAPARRVLPLEALPEEDFSVNTPAFTVSLTSLSQLTSELLSAPLSRIYLPLELLDGPLPAFAGTYCAILPRVWRDRDEPDLRRRIARAKSLGVTALLAGNIGCLSLAEGSGMALCGDYGLNVFNARSLAYLREKGLESACLSFELRKEQIRDMKKVLPAEAIVYGRLPMMITEIPPGGRSGTTLTDRKGARYPLLPAWGGRTEIQNDRVLWLADRGDYRRWGLAFARLRFTVERPEACADVVRAYLSGGEVQGPFTRGLYDRGV